MNRREFFKRSSIIAATGLITGPAALEMLERLAHRKVFALGGIPEANTLVRDANYEYLRIVGIRYNDVHEPALVLFSPPLSNGDVSMRVPISSARSYQLGDVVRIEHGSHARRVDPSRAAIHFPERVGPSELVGT